MGDVIIILIFSLYTAQTRYLPDEPYSSTLMQGFTPRSSL